MSTEQTLEQMTEEQLEDRAKELVKRHQELWDQPRATDELMEELEEVNDELTRVQIQL
jgi:glutamate synthase domain-containing protein 3